MYEDIQDVVKCFVGGKQTVQPGSHTQMRGLQPQVQNAITPFVEKISTNKCMARKQSRIVFSQCFNS